MDGFINPKYQSDPFDLKPKPEQNANLVLFVI